MGSGSKPSENFIDHAIVAFRKFLFLAQTLAFYTRKSCKNERAKMKESRQIDREPRVQCDNRMENINARSPLIFISFL